jgi:hypothetical protein
MEVETSKLSIDARDLIKTSINHNPRINVATTAVPIIFTGNDFTKLYAPLLRAGRMRKFEWVPDENERICIIESIFRPHLTRDECYQLYIACQSFARGIQQANTPSLPTSSPTQCPCPFAKDVKQAGVPNTAYKLLPISFFSALKVEVQDDAIIAMVEKHKWTIASQLFKQNGVTAKSILQTSFNYDICLKKAKERILAQTDRSYL